MKKLVLIFLSFICSALTMYAGEKAPKWVIESSITPEFVDFSNDDRYIVLESEVGYEVWSTESKSKVLEGKYRYPLGRTFGSVYITEGSAYLLFEKEDIFLQVDYTITFAKVNAFDLSTGEKLWSIDNLDMQITDVEALYQIIDNAQRFVKNEEQLTAATFSAATGIRTRSGNNYIPVSYAGHDETIRKLISYMPQKGAIAVNGKDGLQLLNLRTGEVEWRQEELRGGIGEIFHDPINDILIAIRVSGSELKNILSRPEVQALNADTGDLLWNIKYNGDFIPNAAYVMDEVLVLPYFGLMLIDIKTGEELEGDIKEGMERQRKIQRNMSILGSTDLGDNCSRPIVDEDGIAHEVIRLARRKHINPDGNRKDYMKIDIAKGKIIAVEEDVAKQGNRVIQEELTDDMLYLKLTQGLSGSYIMALDKSTGKVAFETKILNNRLGTDFDPFLLSKNRIVDVSSKGIHIFDAKTGKEVKNVSFKNIGVGRFRNHVIFDQGILLLGTKGLAVIDNQGEVKEVIDDDGKIHNLAINEEIWLVEKKRFIKLSTDPLAKIEEMELNRNEMVFFSPNGTYIMKLNADTNQIVFL